MLNLKKVPKNRWNIFLLILVFLIPGHMARVEAKRMRIDDLTGKSYGELINGKIPDTAFWSFIQPQREYMKMTYGPEISSTLDLYEKELEFMDASSNENKQPDAIEGKTIRRWPDPIVIHGGSFPSLEGKTLTKMRAYALHLGKFIPIPYQFDEYTSEGKKVLPDGGPAANPEDGNGLLDPQDEFLLMAHDLGDRTDPEKRLSGFETVQEITVKDPFDGSLGWCYLYYFPDDPPPRSPLNYATYNTKYNQLLSFYVFIQCAFKLVDNELYRQIFPQKMMTPDYAGGNFMNFIDRVKYRVRVRLMFGMFKIQVTEDQFTGDTVAIRDGPVRCTRRVSGKIQLPLGLETPEIVGDIAQYDSYFLVPAELAVPFNPGLVLTDLTMYSGTEPLSDAIGARWYNSNNLEGFVVDSRMSENEKQMDPKFENWRLMTGNFGTCMNRSIWDPEFIRQAKIHVEFVDDRTKKDPPEYDKGQIGMAYSYATVENLNPGNYVTEIDWLFPPRFNDPSQPERLNAEMVTAYMDMYDKPLEIRTEKDWFPNTPKPQGIKR